MNFPEQPTPPELRPADKESIVEFLQNVEKISAGGHIGKATGSEGRKFTLSDGRIVSVHREGHINEKQYPKDPIASVSIYEREDDQQKVVHYFLYGDNKMEKAIDIESIEELKKELSGFDPDEDPAVSILKAEEDVRKFRATVSAVEQERKLGLRSATEADMQETRELFAQLEEQLQIQKEENS